MLCLLGFATQNLGSICLSGGRAQNALDASVANVSGRSNRSTVVAAMGSFGKLIEELPAMMRIWPLTSLKIPMPCAALLLSREISAAKHLRLILTGKSSCYNQIVHFVTNFLLFHCAVRNDTSKLTFNATSTRRSLMIRERINRGNTLNQSTKSISNTVMLWRRRCSRRGMR